MATSQLLPEVEHPYVALQLTKDEAYFLVRLLGHNIVGGKKLRSISDSIYNTLNETLPDRTIKKVVVSESLLRLLGD